MSHTPLPSDDPRLTAYALGELDPTERQDLERLLADSPEARAAVQEIRDLAGLLTTQLRQEPAPSLTAAQRAAIVEAGSLPANAGERNGAMSDQRIAVLATHYRSAADYQSQHTPRVKRFATLAAVAALLVVVALLVTPPRGERSALIADNSYRVHNRWSEFALSEGFDSDVSNPDGARGGPGGVDVTPLSSVAASSASGAAASARTTDAESSSRVAEEQLHQTARRSYARPATRNSSADGLFHNGFVTESASRDRGDAAGDAAKESKVRLRTTAAKDGKPMDGVEPYHDSAETGPVDRKVANEKGESGSSSGNGSLPRYAGFKPAGGDQSGGLGNRPLAHEGPQKQLPTEAKSSAGGVGGGGMSAASAPAGAMGGAGGRARYNLGSGVEAAEGESRRPLAQKKTKSSLRGIAPASGPAGRQLAESQKAGDSASSKANDYAEHDSQQSNKPASLSKYKSDVENRDKQEGSAGRALHGDNSPSDAPVSSEVWKGLTARRQKWAGKSSDERAPDVDGQGKNGVPDTLGEATRPFEYGSDHGKDKSAPSGDKSGKEIGLQDSILFRQLADLGTDSYAVRGAESEGLGTEAYTPIVENPFLSAYEDPLSTFGVDVDTASYANVRRFLTNHQLPPRDAVRIEELINYFSYDYPQPAADQPFSVTVDAANCPWNPVDKLVRIGVKGKEIARDKRPPSNLVFLVDVSGSMQAENKLPLVKMGLNLLTQQMTETDQVAIVTYSDSAVQRLEATNGDNKPAILGVIDSLQAAGSTNGAAGIQLAYRAAIDHFIAGGTNRVILCTDGDFNVGVTSDDALVELIQERARTKVFFSVFGFGMGNLKDGKLEKLADKGNGHYAYVDGQNEARKMFVDELVGTLVTIAKDVKLQVEFNPNQVGSYRLLGYENRVMAAADFNNDKKDAGDVGAGHSVTALYEVVPAAAAPKPELGDGLRYRKAVVPQEGNLARELLTVKLRYKLPEADASTLVEYPIADPANLAAVADGRGDTALFSFQLHHLEARVAADNLRELFGEGQPGAPVIEADASKQRLLFRGTAEQVSLGRQTLAALGEPGNSASADLNWAAAVAAFGLILRDSQFRGQCSLDMVLELATAAKGADPNGRRQEFIELVKRTKEIVGRRTEAGFIDTLSRIPREQLESLASVDGKYKNLLRIVEVPGDVSSYGAARDFGRWEGTSYANQNNLPQGYWVYVYPNWYIWGDAAK